jgi:O-Antigen ligase
MSHIGAQRQGSRLGAVPARGFTDRYLVLLMLVLAGYAMFGRGFAYVGYTPIFIGEVTLALGLIALASSGALFAVLSNPLSLCLFLLFAWVMARTIPFIGIYRIDALRDSVIVIYSLYALTVAALLLEKPDRIRTLIKGYRLLAIVLPLITPPLYVIATFVVDVLPYWPGSQTRIISLRGGDVAVHLCGIMLFALLGFVRLPLISIVMLFAGMMIVGSQNRGGIVAMLVPLAVAWVLVPRMRQLPRIAGIGGVTVLLASVFGVSLALPLLASERLISTDQLFRNLTSIVFSTSDPALEGTKLWRLQWWDTIMSYTVHGQYFWTGKGFGINLADSDGFQVIEQGTAQLLRSPHNSHLTMLARAGVPGIILWAVVNLSWGAAMVWNALQSRWRGQSVWSRFLVFIFGYWLAIVIDSAFDVALEGPMLGIWYWTLFGTGMAAMVICAYEARQRSRVRPRRRGPRQPAQLSPQPAR